MAVKWIDAKAIEADVAMYGPVINMITKLVPGVSGTALSDLLVALESPTVVDAAVAAVNAVSGAAPPS